MEIQIQRLPAGRGAGWWTDSWKWITQEFGTWLGVSAVGFIIIMAAGAVPFLGSVISEVVRWPLYGSLLIMAREVARGRPIKFEDMFGAFKTHFGSLVLLGIISGAIALFAIAIFAGVPAFFMWPQLKDAFGLLPEQLYMEAFQLVAPWLIFALVGLGIAVGVAMVAQFAMPLVLFRNLTPTQAMSVTWKGLNANIGAVLVAGLVSFFWLILACLPLFLGLLVFIPWSMAAQYKMYEEIFGDVSGET